MMLEDFAGSQSRRARRLEFTREFVDATGENRSSLFDVGHFPMTFYFHASVIHEALLRARLRRTLS